MYVYMCVCVCVYIYGCKLRIQVFRDIMLCQVRYP